MVRPFGVEFPEDGRGPLFALGGFLHDDLMGFLQPDLDDSPPPPLLPGGGFVPPPPPRPTLHQ